MSCITQIAQMTLLTLGKQKGTERRARREDPGGLAQVSVSLNLVEPTETNVRRQRKEYTHLTNKCYFLAGVTLSLDDTSAFCEQLSNGPISIKVKSQTMAQLCC